jgi:ribose transport system ATP-binding protein
VVGENGAGKSTLMKSIAGAVLPTAGVIEVYGSHPLPGNPRQAEEVGVAMIYQELTIVPDLSAEANVFLGHIPSRWGVQRRKELRRRYLDVALRVGGHISPEARAGALSTANQQLLEIMKAVAHGRRLVIMDEPTASLGPQEIERLHGIIRELKARGCAVLYVSHDLDAVLDISDEVMVMREGEVVANHETSAWTQTAIVEAMLGEGLDKKAEHPVLAAEGNPIFRVRELRAPGVDVSNLSIRAGEVVGIAGLVGSGRTRMLRAIAGASRAQSGSLEIDGREVRWPASPAHALQHGIALAPEDRKHQGLVLERESAWNIAMGGFGLARLRGRITSRSLRAWAKPLAIRVAFQPEFLRKPAGALSGGNQQKLMLGRLFARSPRLMLLDEPTRGMDIGAKGEVFASMRRFAKKDHAVLWSSSEIQEVLDHSDRVFVVRSGRLVEELSPNATVHDVFVASFSRADRELAFPGLAVPLKENSR